MSVHVTNRRAFRDFEILETYEAGLQLTGSEVKSIKNGRAILSGAFVKVIGGELYLVNAQIPLYSYARHEGYDAKRSRKLLLHRQQILSLTHTSQTKHLTIVPLECYTTRGFVKVKIALAKGRKEFQKREKIKRQDIQRETDREIRGRK